MLLLKSAPISHRHQGPNPQLTIELSIQYEYRCQLTGVVKAYKKMPSQRAKTLNGALESQDARGRWMPRLAATEVHSKDIHKYSNDIPLEQANLR